MRVGASSERTNRPEDPLSKELTIVEPLIRLAVMGPSSNALQFYIAEPRVATGSRRNAPTGPLANPPLVSLSEAL